MFQVFFNRKQGYTLELQRIYSALVDLVVGEVDAGDQIILLQAFERSDAVNGTLQFHVSSVFSALYSVARNIHIITVKEKEHGHRLQHL